MSISAALKKNADAFAEAQKTYQDDVYDVSLMMSQVFAATLPAVNNVPANWEAIKTAYTTARVDALDWTNDVYATLQATPDEVRNYNDIISALFDDALDQAQILIDNQPQDGDSPEVAASKAAASKTAKSVLNADMKTINSKLHLVNLFITGCTEAVDAFGTTTLPEAASSLTTVSNDAYEDHVIDEDKIRELKAQIKALKEEMAELAAAIGIAAGAMVAEVAIGACFAELGPAEWAIVGIGVGVSAATIALDTKKLIEDQNALRALNTSLDSYTQDSATLQTMADTYDELALQTTAIGSSVSAIADAWQAVEDDMTRAAADMAEALKDENAGNYDELYDDLAAAQAEWDATYAACGSLEVNVYGTPAQLTIGMTSAEVSAAQEAAGTVPLVEYVNNYSRSYAAAAVAAA
ncbi:MAG TPA: hypothetical protein VIT92_05135 [Burkholderiaceae bacterium]